MNPNLITEDKILDFLDLNIELKKNFFELLRYEVSVVEQNAPHIVESWMYYNKFMESCKNLNFYKK